MKKALVIGIDNYPTQPLTGCVNDAMLIANTLEKNGDGSPNFDVKLITSNTEEVNGDVIQSNLEELFKGDAETALFYFAGHGIINEATNTGYIVAQDGKKPSWGISLGGILEMANKAYPKIKSTVIILDSCNSGYMGEISGLGNQGISIIGTGVTILTACHRNGGAAEEDGNGLFTTFLLDGLSGSAADILGRITPASIYSHIDQLLSSWEQRPIYKANVQTFVTLREVAPKIPRETLRRLHVYFKNPTDIFSLDPSFEPDRENIPLEFRHIPVNEENTHILKELQDCNRHGLVVPVGAEHMYYATIHSTGCKLTSSGAHYRKMAELGRI